MKHKIQFSQLIIFLILGILVVVQIKSIQIETLKTKRQKDINNLQQQLLKQREISAKYQEQLKAVEKKVEEYKNSHLVNNGSGELQNELEYAKFAAGLTDVSGQGIAITLDDSKKRISESENPNNALIHDSDLIEITNLLKIYGAQAISINDERIVSTSEIQCAGPTVSVNGIRYAVPFQIRAIGNADYLEAGIKSPGNILDIMSIYGIQISIKKENNIKIPKYNFINKNIIYSEIGG